MRIMCFYCYAYVFWLYYLDIFIVLYVLFCVLCLIVLLCLLFLCKWVLYYCHRVSTQLQLKKYIVYHIYDFAFVGLDNKLYKMHGTYIKILILISW
jgi:hypothetical protein